MDKFYKFLPYILIVLLTASIVTLYFRNAQLNKSVLNYNSSLKSYNEQLTSFGSELKKCSALINLNAENTTKIFKLNGNVNYSHYNIVLKYDGDPCLSCISGGVAILENAFKNKLKGRLIIIGHDLGWRKMAQYQHFSEVKDAAPQINYAGSQYICLLNEQGAIKLILPLTESNYGLNQKVLSDLAAGDTN